MTTDTVQHDPAPSPAREYEEYYGPAMFGPLAEVTLDRAGVQRGERVLDLACGTGIVARRAAHRVGRPGRVVGVDINPAMLEEADARAAAEGLEVEWRHGDLAELDLPDGGFDLVTCQQGLQFLPDRAAGARHMRRVLDADGGRAVVLVWRGLDHHPLFAALFEAELPHLRDFGLDVGLADLQAPFSLGDPDELEALLLAAGFSEVSLEAHTLHARFATPERFVARLEHAYAAVVPAFAEDPSAFEEYLERVSAATTDLVAAHRDGDHVAFPMHLTVAVARV